MPALAAAGNFSVGDALGTAIQPNLHSSMCDSSPSLRGSKPCSSYETYELLFEKGHCNIRVYTRPVTFSRSARRQGWPAGMQTRAAKRRRLEQDALVQWQTMPTGPLLRVFEIASGQVGGSLVVSSQAHQGWLGQHSCSAGG